MTDLVNTCPEESMVTFVPTKMLLEKYESVMKIKKSYHILVDLDVGFATSPRLKKTDNLSSSYDRFSEGVSLYERRLPHKKQI